MSTASLRLAMVMGDQMKDELDRRTQVVTSRTVLANLPNGRVFDGAGETPNPKYRTPDIDGIWTDLQNGKKRGRVAFSGQFSGLNLPSAIALSPRTQVPGPVEQSTAKVIEVAKNVAEGGPSVWPAILTIAILSVVAIKAMS